MAGRSEAAVWGQISRAEPRAGLFPMRLPATRAHVSAAESEGPEVRERLRHGDRAAFEAIYSRELPYVMALLTRGFSYRSAGVLRRVSGLPSAFDAEDLCQEAFRRFYERCLDGGFDVTRPVRPYLTRIVVNLAFKQFARDRREAPLHDLEIAAPAQPDRAEQAECAALLEEFRSGLDDRQQAVFHGYFKDQQGSQAEVAAQLGLSRDQVARAVVSIRSQCLSFFTKRGWFSGP